MNNLKTFLVSIFLFTFFFVSASNNIDLDPTHFSEFRKNEEPTNVKFNILTLNEFSKKGNFYVIYKTNESSEGYYFKIQFDQHLKLIGTSYAKADQNLNEKTIENLKAITNNLLHPPVTNGFEETEPGPTRCVIDCNRKEGCYNKSDNEAVLVCSTTCILGCS